MKNITMDNLKALGSMYGELIERADVMANVKFRFNQNQRDAINVLSLYDVDGYLFVFKAEDLWSNEKIVEFSMFDLLDEEYVKKLDKKLRDEHAELEAQRLQRIEDNKKSAEIRERKELARLKSIYE